jgi:protein-S-isoprenylcysteine O-methyltransferase Ste14
VLANPFGPRVVYLDGWRANLRPLLGTQMRVADVSENSHSSIESCEVPVEWLVLGLYALYLTFAVGVRMLVQRMRTGSSGFTGVRGSVGSIEWFAPSLFVGSYALGVAAPVLSLVGIDRPLAIFFGMRPLGVLFFTAGFLLTVWAQFAMGESWRIGVAREDRTALVQKGPFAVVRNPIFAAMLLAEAGLALSLPNASAIVAALGLLLAVELQVRGVEEPHLLRAHGEAYETYRRRVGRFLPRLHVS